MTCKKEKPISVANRIDASTGSRYLPLTCVLMVSLWGAPGPAIAHTGSLPPTLKDVVVPEVPGLLDGPRPIVVNKEKAIALGKALFWDMNVGSDNMACASCHFHAGADGRSKNQFTPGKTHLPAKPGDPNAFDPNDPRGPNLSNYQLTKRDFPLYQFDPSTGLLKRESYTYNAVASAGTFSGSFVRANGRGEEECKPFYNDQTFHVGGIHTRRVEPRNAPNFINSVLFDRLFWDGRANFIFNGVSNWGARDPDAFVWVRDEGSVWKMRIALPNAALASQAVATSLNEFEMSCKGRTLKDIGRKLLRRRPLEKQMVHPDDSVLGPYRHRSGKGLNVTYESLIKQAFAPRFWSAGRHPLFGKPGYSHQGFSQAEANFSLFFGLAIQLYGSTLISDDTPFDRANIQLTDKGDFVDENGVLADTPNSRPLQGLKLFNEAHCIFCHTGPLFSTATNRTTYDKEEGTATTRTMVKRELTADGAYRVTDAGFLNNGAVPSEADPGLYNTDDYGNPLAFAPQYLGKLAGRQQAMIEPLPLARACDIGFVAEATKDFFTEQAFGTLIPDPVGAEGCAKPENAFVPQPGVVAAALDNPADKRLHTNGHMFKVPQLYNVELTGPYMHNGGMSNLEQVVEHYLSGGNFSPGRTNVPGNPVPYNGELENRFVFEFGATGEERQALVDFLKTLTDERVRYERAPFDHPQLLVPNGHPGDEHAVEGSAADPGLAKDDILEVPAVGKDGRSQPLKSFEENLPD